MTLFSTNIEYKCRKTSQLHENHEILHWNKFTVKFWLNATIIRVSVSENVWNCHDFTLFKFYLFKSINIIIFCIFISTTIDLCTFGED